MLCASMKERRNAKELSVIEYVGRDVRTKEVIRVKSKKPITKCAECARCRKVKDSNKRYCDILFTIVDVEKIDLNCNLVEM